MTRGCVFGNTKSAGGANTICRPSSRASRICHMVTARLLASWQPQLIAGVQINDPASDALVKLTPDVDDEGLLRAEFAVAKPTQKLARLAELSAADFLAEVKAIRGRSAPLGVADVKRLNEAYAASVLPLHANAREADRLERRVSDLVNAAYGLTPDDVALLWKTAPPRMPFQSLESAATPK